MLENFGNEVYVYGDNVTTNYPFRQRQQQGGNDNGDNAPIAVNVGEECQIISNRYI